MAIGEKGWKSKYDEGVRLMTKSNKYTGISAFVTLPNHYECAEENSYFTFYLGINETSDPKTSKTQIESGISYSTKGWKLYCYSEKEDKDEVLKFKPTGKQLVRLYIDANKVYLEALGKRLVASTDLKSGAPKMIIAVGEFHEALKDRKVWFNQVSWSARRLHLGNDHSVKSDLISPLNVAGEFNSYLLDLKLFTPKISDYTAEVVMPNIAKYTKSLIQKAVSG